MEKVKYTINLWDRAGEHGEISRTRHVYQTAPDPFREEFKEPAAQPRK